MAKDVAIIVVHGMGDTRRDFDRRLKALLKRRLGARSWARLSWQKVYYQAALQENQERYFRESRRRADIDWLRLRRFVLYGFSDAASMQTQPQQRGSAYEKVQDQVLGAIRNARVALAGPDRPVVVVAHSLGCQVMSNFIWDAQQHNVSAGVFRKDVAAPVGARAAEDRFLRLKTMRYFFTSGCNIPIFVAGIARDDIRPVLVDARGWQFRWHNYYDPDDVLGWPLKPLCPAYREAVAVDEAISVGGPISSWTPLSHTEYWDDDDFLDPLEAALQSLLER